MSEHSTVPTHGIDDHAVHEGTPGAGRRLMRVFKRLREGTTETVRHGMGTFPLVDVYQLDYFPVVSAADGDPHVAWVNFYLYHTADRSVREPGTTARIVLDVRGEPETRLPLEPLLREYGVPYDDATHLGDVVNEFWKAFFAPPSDTFDETSHANSPWLDRCCGDRRTVGELKNGGTWDDLWLHFRPRKTINYPRVDLRGGRNGTEEHAPAGAPAQLQVTQVDYQAVGLRLLPPEGRLYEDDPVRGEQPIPADEPIHRDELNVMVLLHA